MKNLLLFGMVLSIFIKGVYASPSELGLLTNISGLKEYEKTRYNSHLALSKVKLLCFDINAPEHEPSISISYDQSMSSASDSCCVKVYSNSEVVKAGVFSITEDKKTSVDPFNIFSNSSNDRMIRSEANDGSAWLDIHCSNSSLNPLNNFSISEINKILGGLVEIQ